MRLKTLTPHSVLIGRHPTLLETTSLEAHPTQPAETSSPTWLVPVGLVSIWASPAGMQPQLPPPVIKGLAQ